MSKNIKKLNFSADRKIIETTEEDVKSQSMDSKMIGAVLQTIQTQHTISIEKEHEQNKRIYELEKMNSYLKTYAEKFHNEAKILKTQQESLKSKGIIDKSAYNILSDVGDVTKRNKILDDKFKKDKKLLDDDIIEQQKNLFGPI